LSLAKSSREYTWYTTLPSFSFNEMKQQKKRVTASAAAARSVMGVEWEPLRKDRTVQRMPCLC